MKKIYINEDGTINLKTVFFTILIFLFVLLVIMYIITLYNKPITEEDGKRIETTSKKISTMNLCKDCKLEFLSKSYNLKTGENILLSSLMNLKSINIKNVKFSDYDESIIEISSTKNGVMLKALNKLGSTTLKATYQEKETKIEINVFSDYITSAKLFKDNYYVYLDDTAQLSLDTNPLNVEASFFNVSVENQEIASIKDGIITGKNLGKTAIKMEYNGETSESNLYVIKSRIAIYIMNGDKQEEVSDYTTNVKTFNILVKCLDKDISSSDLEFSISNGGSVTYIEPDIEEPNSFKYNVSISDSNSHFLEFTLNDGSKTGMNINYKGN